MNTPSQRRLCGSGPAGVALFLTLAFLALIVTLVLAFLASVTGELQTARSSVSQITAKQLADTSVQVVSSLIRMATNSNGKSTTWASQPGMIRTYGSGSGTASSAPLAYFKLYSSDNMEVTQSEMAAYDMGADVDGLWDTKTAMFTDLNSPVRDGAGKVHFPIIDPRAQSASPSTSVQGFTYNKNITTKIGDVPVDGVVQPGGAADSQRLPMPVKWIYVLKDGTLTAPRGVDIATGKIANWTNAPADKIPSATNPIVGRIAFWTDDECCKLNLNTASEPTPWDTPRALVFQDLNYGKYQPAQKEYQRFPGHPYTTALSPVFFPNTPTLTSQQKKTIYDLIPRVQWGGSCGATVSATTAAVVKPDADRLFASVDEFVFAAATATAARPLNTLVTPAQIEQARFFLTASSRAPEVNLFGQPRVSLWPVNTNAAQRTAYDKLAAFCGTTGGAASAKEYFFKRSDAISPTADWTAIARNRELYAYLQRLTGSPVPGYGGSFLSKWGQDRDQVLTEIFDYIRCVNIHDSQPGATQFAGDDNSATEYPYAAAGEGQVAPIQIADTQGFGRFHTISQAGMHFICSQEEDQGILAPGNKLGANERLVNVSLLFEPWSPALGFYPIYEKLYFDVQFGSGFTLGANSQPLLMRAGGKALSNKIGSGWHCNGREHGGSGGLRGPMQAFGGGSYQWVSQAETILTKGTRVKGVKVTGPTMKFVGGDVTIRIYSGSSAAASNLVQTVNLRMPDGNFPVPNLVRTGTLPMQPGAGGGGSSVSEWWAFDKRYARPGETPHMPGDEYADPKRRWKSVDGPSGFKIGGIFRDEDVVRTVVPEHGDLRLIAAKRNVPASDFVKVREAEWEKLGDRMLHIFSSSAGPHIHYGFCNEPGNRPGGPNRLAPVQSNGSPGGTLGGIPGAAPDDQLVASSAVNYHYARLPEIKPGAGKKFNLWNDYDNGVSTWTDGSYINKPDEGNFSSTSSPYTYFAWNTAADSTGNFFSPSRLIPSAGMFGSLPTGVKRHSNSDPHAWETLLFRPEVRKTAGGKPHPGTQSPKDYLIMDLFWMPVIEPYAISEPFSTAGKINLNYQIAPFSYIRRVTALVGAMKSEEPLILPNSVAPIYKLWDHETDRLVLPSSITNQNPTVRTEWTKAYNNQAPYDKLRRAIDAEKTLGQADTRFASGDIFRSATEICELHLVRSGESLADYQSGKIWQDALITGENTRERPYTNLYAKLTTRSNTYTVHMRVQVLKKSRSSDAAQWDETKDKVLSEHRGSSLIERYVDAAETSLPDFADPLNATKNLDAYYKFRVLSTKKF